MEAAARRAFGSRLRSDRAVARLGDLEPAAAEAAAEAAAADLPTAVGTWHRSAEMLDGSGQRRPQQLRHVYGLRQPHVAAVAAAPRALALSPDTARKVPSGQWIGVSLPTGRYADVEGAHRLVGGTGGGAYMWVAGLWARVVVGESAGSDGSGGGTSCCSVTRNPHRHKHKVTGLCKVRHEAKFGSVSPHSCASWP